LRTVNVHLLHVVILLILTISGRLALYADLARREILHGDLGQRILLRRWRLGPVPRLIRPCRTGFLVRLSQHVGG
jgi:hypothetical protein